MGPEEHRLLARLKERATRKGYHISKSRAPRDADSQGQYRLTNVIQNMVVLGERYDASLRTIEGFLQAATCMSPWAQRKKDA